MQYWLVKSEPNAYSWNDLVKHKHTNWDGVRNYQARNNMQKMRLGDQVFFYHSIHDKAIVGVMEVCGDYEPDPGDISGKFIQVPMKPLKPAKHWLTLAEIKMHDQLKEMSLVKQSRLSVMPVTNEQAAIIFALAFS